MAYKQNLGRGPKMKTGGGIPSALLQEDPTDPVKKKTDEKTGAEPSFPGVTWTRPPYQTQPNTYSRIQEDAAIKSDSILSSIVTRKKLLHQENYLKVQNHTSHVELIKGIKAKRTAQILIQKPVPLLLVLEEVIKDLLYLEES